MRIRPTFDDLVRAVVGAGALAAVVFLAVATKSEAAAGALIGLLGLFSSFLYRGKVERQTP